MTFSFVQITDHHLLESESSLKRGYNPAHALRAVLRDVGRHAQHVDFIVTTGDLVENGTEVEYVAARHLLGMREFSQPPGPQPVTVEGLEGMPMYFLPGNHDHRPTMGRAMFGASDADEAIDRSFIHKGIQFICLDFGPGEQAVVTDRMLEHVRSALAPGAPTIILCHHNVTKVGMPRLDAYVADRIEELKQALRAGNVLAIFAGHVHLSYESSLGHIPVYGLGSTNFSYLENGSDWYVVLRPPTYRIVTIDAGRVETKLIEVALQ